MNKNISVFQMSLIDTSDTVNGLMFSSEIDNGYFQNIQFCIPVPRDINSFEHLSRYINNVNIYMPFSFNNDVISINAVSQFPYLIFDLQRKFGENVILKFKIELFNRHSSHVRHVRYLKSLRNSIKAMRVAYNFRLTTLVFSKFNYIGKAQFINKRTTQFILLKPIDVNSLNDYYKKYDVLPVGVTLKFANKEHFLKSDEERKYER